MAKARLGADKHWECAEEWRTWELRAQGKIGISFEKGGAT